MQLSTLADRPHPHWTPAGRCNGGCWQAGWQVSVRAREYTQYSSNSRQVLAVVLQCAHRGDAVRGECMLFYITIAMIVIMLVIPRSLLCMLLSSRGRSSAIAISLPRCLPAGWLAGERASLQPAAAGSFPSNFPSCFLLGALLAGVQAALWASRAKPAITKTPPTKRHGGVAHTQTLFFLVFLTTRLHAGTTNSLCRTSSPNPSAILQISAKLPSSPHL